MPRLEPGEVVKPQASIVAEKYAAILGVQDKGDIQNGRLYEFVDDWMGDPIQVWRCKDKDGVLTARALAQLLQQQVYGIKYTAVYQPADKCYQT